MTISRRRDLVQTVDLAGHTLIGEPFPIPSALAGLEYQTLEDMTALASADPSWIGRGFWPVIEVAPTLPSPWHRPSASQSLSLDVESRRVPSERGVKFRPLAHRQLAMCQDVRARLAASISAGFTYEVPGSGVTHTYQIDDPAKSNMLAVETEFLGGVMDAHGGYWRSSSNVNVTMSDGDVRVFFRAAKAYKMTAVRNAQALADAISASPDHAALDAVDPGAGWP